MYWDSAKALHKLIKHSKRFSLVLGCGVALNRVDDRTTTVITTRHNGLMELPKDLSFRLEISQACIHAAELVWVDFITGVNPH